MKRVLLTMILVVPLVVGLGLLLSSEQPLKAASSMTPLEGRGCSLARLAGHWGYTYSGTIVGLGPAASVGSFAEDVAGNIKGAQTRSFNGDVEDETLTGTVQVNADCTGTATISVYLNGALERTSVLNVVYVDNQSGFRAIFTTPGLVISADGRRIGD